MKKYFLYIHLFLASSLYAQFDLSAGMGLNFFSAPDLEDYFNSSTHTEEVNSFNTSADFFVEFGYEYSHNLQFGIEYNFNIYSINAPILDLEFNHHQPSLIAYYFVTGEGYKLKIGGGVGLRYSQVAEKIYGEIKDYSTTGLGILAKAQGDTKLANDFYALIAGEIRYDMPGEINTITGSLFNINSFGVALKLGTVYYF